MDVQIPAYGHFYFQLAIVCSCFWLAIGFIADNVHSTI